MSQMGREELLLLVLRLRYEESLKDGEIAVELNKRGYAISTKNTRDMSNLAAEAGDWLIGEYWRLKSLDMYAHRDAHMFPAHFVREKYGLLDVQIVPGGETTTAQDYSLLINSYGRQAARWMEEFFSTEERSGRRVHVAVSGGQTIMDAVSHLPQRTRENVSFYASAMLGRGAINWTPHVGPETNATLAWSRSGRIPKHLFYGSIGPYAIRKEDISGPPKAEIHDWVQKSILKQRAALSKSIEVQGVMTILNESVNMAIAGLGVTEASEDDVRLGSGHVERMTMMNLLRPLKIDLPTLSKEGAVGDMSYCLFDKEGKEHPDWKFFLTAGAGTEFDGLKFYQNLVEKERPVIVMAGMKKLSALLPALEAKPKMFNVLITDQVTADRLYYGEDDHGEGMRKAIEEMRAEERKASGK